MLPAGYYGSSKWRATGSSLDFVLLQTQHTRELISARKTSSSSFSLRCHSHVADYHSGTFGDVHNNNKSPHFSSGHNCLKFLLSKKNFVWPVTQKCLQSSPLLHPWRESFSPRLARGKKESPLYCVLGVMRLSCWQWVWRWRGGGGTSLVLMMGHWTSPL